MFNVIYNVSDVEVMILWYWMNSTSGKDSLVSQMYMQSLTFTHATSLTTCMKDEMYGSHDMLQEGLCSHCWSMHKSPNLWATIITGLSKIILFLYVNSTKADFNAEKYLLMAYDHLCWRTGQEKVDHQPSSFLILQYTASCVSHPLALLINLVRCYRWKVAMTDRIIGCILLVILGGRKTA